ncbi:peptide chain release factor 1 [Oryzomicrobium terrae]|uniref:Peptide chain release factor 1 n=1 Tax=Oryzomicrobium terrae TaxID=1735038 RepID=A0A5C1EB70_9RHOO|nr:peptide chain release factor 1 [Oryzomicrobium terrae]QEL66106.1 peptide chain release factor 1 [Oryzomicrobium terrae]
MKSSIREKLDTLARRLAEVDALLSSENAAADLDQFRKLSRERAELEPVVTLYQAYRQTEADMADAEAMLADPDMKALAQEELAAAKEKLPEIELELQKLLLPRDPNDDRNIVLEIRAGTGGDESALFAGDLFRMYTRYAERNRWQMEVLSASESDLGGYKEVICRIIGNGAYSRLKFESGGHRVQRVPETETQGRIHTSACTVAVMPEADDVSDVDINPADLKIDTYRASGAGGQHVNKTESAVRITHLPTGTVAECQDGRSQHQNRESAMRVLVARIKDAQIRAAQAKEAATRKSLIGSGDRSERIRTYNFPQGRITDHRINLTLYKIAAIMDGDLDELIGALANEHQAEQLANLAEQA